MRVAIGCIYGNRDPRVEADPPPRENNDPPRPASKSGVIPKVTRAAIEEAPNLIGVETSKAHLYMYIAPRRGKKIA